MKYLWKEVGLKKTIISMLNIYKSLLGILKMRFKMKKKWPLKVPESYLKRKILTSEKNMEYKYFQ